MQSQTAAVPARQLPGVGARIAKTFAAYGASQIISLVNAVLSVPFLIHHWGLERFSEWLLLTTMPSYMSVTDIGIGVAAANQVAVFSARGEKKKAVGAYQTAWVTALAISLICAVGFFAVTSALPFEQWFHITLIGHRECVAVINVLMLQVLVSQQTGLAKSAFRCEGNYSKALTIVNATSICQIVGMVIVVSKHYGPGTLAATMLTISASGCLALFIRGHMLVPWLKLGVRHANRAQFRELLAPAVTQTFFPLGWSTSLQGMTMAIGYVLGPVAAGGFTTIRTMTRVVNQLTGIVDGTFGPEFSSSIGGGDLKLARTLHHRASQISLWLGVASAVGMAVVGPFIYGKWTGHKYVLNYPIFYLLLGALVVNGAYYGSIGVPRSVNRHVKLGPQFLAVYAASVGVAFITLHAFGPIGAAISVFLAEVAIFFLVVPLACRIVHDDWWLWAKESMTPNFGWLVAKIRSKVGRSSSQLHITAEAEPLTADSVTGEFNLDTLPVLEETDKGVLEVPDEIGDEICDE